MSRTLHERPVDDQVPLKKSHTRYWNRRDYMHFKVPHALRKISQQLNQDLQLEDE